MGAQVSREDMGMQTYHEIVLMAFFDKYSELVYCLHIHPNLRFLGSETHQIYHP